jgi:hypothetical protein
MVDVDSIFLKEGQIGIYDTRYTSENGCKAVIDFTGKPRNDKRYEIRIGRNEQAASRSIYDKDFSTPLFSLNEITEIYASWPKKDHAYVDAILCWVITEMILRIPASGRTHSSALTRL